MTSLTDLKTIERNAYQSRFKDGLWDLTLGALLLYWWGFGMLMRNAEEGAWRGWMLLAALLSFGLVLLHILIKRRVTDVRLGTITPGPVRRQKLRTVAWVLGALVVLQFLLVLLTGRGAVDFSGLLMKMVAGLFVFIPISAIAFWHDFPRGYVHALLLGMAVPAYMTFGSDIPLLVTGVVILAIGATVLIRFLREYPPPGEMSNEGSSQ
jgi:hypothetical protein